ncbi:MAG TPA: Bax inhibitor-1 family protein [Polyangiaceae bacterium]
MQPGYGHQALGQAYDPVEARGRFIARTYNHLFGAIVAFAAIEIALFQTGLAQIIASSMLGVSWLLVLGGFMVAGWAASHVAQTSRSLPAQYAALAGYVVIEALIFVPILVIADGIAAGMISSAAIVTLLGFACLTGVALVTRKDFSFLRSIMIWGGVGAMLLIVGGLLFGFQLGMFFSVAMVVLAGVAILYDTSNVVHHFPEDRYVGASLQLFSSVALMFWYVLRIFMSSRD